MGLQLGSLWLLLRGCWVTLDTCVTPVCTQVC